MYGLPETQSKHLKNLQTGISHANSGLYSKTPKLPTISWDIQIPASIGKHEAFTLPTINLPVNNVITLNGTSGNIEINLADPNKNYFKASINGNTNFVFIGEPPQTGYEFTLEINFIQNATYIPGKEQTRENENNKPTVTFPTGVMMIPTLENHAGSSEILKLSTLDRGVTWGVINAEGLFDAIGLQNLQELYDSLNQAWEAFLADPLGSLTGLTEKIGEEIRKIFTIDLEATWNIVSDWYTDNVAGIADTIWAGLTQMYNDVTAFIANPWTKIAEWGNSFIEEVTSWLNSDDGILGVMYRGVDATIKSIWGSITTIGTVAWNVIKTVGAAVWTGLKATWDSISEIFRDKTSSDANPRYGLDYVWPNIVTYLTSANITGLIGDAWNTVSNWVGNAVTNIGKAFSEATEGFLKWVNDIWVAATTVGSAAVDWASGVADDISNWLFGGKSPVQFAHAESELEIQNQLLEGGDIENKIEADLTALFNSIKTALGSAATIVGDTFQNILDGFGSLFGGLGSATIPPNLSVTTLDVSGQTNLNGNVQLGNQHTDRIYLPALFGSHLIPASDEDFNIGESLKKWNNLYVQNAFVYGGIVVNSSVHSDLTPFANGSISSYTLGTATKRWHELHVWDIDCGDDIEIGGELNHDGAFVGFYGHAPVSQQSVSYANSTNTGILRTRLDDLIYKLGLTGIIEIN